MLSDDDIHSESYTLLYCSSIGLSFRSEKLPSQHIFPNYQVKHPRTIEVIDIHPVFSSVITEYIHIDCTIGNNYKCLVAYIA
jgi:hypothetical protein